MAVHRGEGLRRETGHDVYVNALKSQINLLHDQVDTLKRKLEDRKEEARRKDHLLAAALERIPELETAQEPREPPVTTSEEPEGRVTAGRGAPLLVAKGLGGRLMSRHDDERHADRAWVDEVGWGCTTVIVAVVLIEAARCGDVESAPALFVLVIVGITVVLWLSPYQRSR